MKVERVSYDVITPSAARAIFDAILWKPAIRWRVTKIDVLAPIRWLSIRRNEVGKVASPRSAGFFIEDERQQRAGLVLRDVKYRLHAEFDFIPLEQRGKTVNPVPEWLIDAGEACELRTPDVRLDETQAKYAAMFERRARKGQCFNQPYLGCREFACGFRLVDPVAEPATPITETRDLGWMLYDLDFADPGDPKPMFFRAQLDNGVVIVPSPGCEEVRR
jgi:CRISPR-associated protein Cas5d